MLESEGKWISKIKEEPIYHESYGESELVKIKEEPIDAFRIMKHYESPSSVHRRLELDLLPFRMSLKQKEIRRKKIKRKNRREKEKIEKRKK